MADVKNSDAFIDDANGLSHCGRINYLKRKKWENLFDGLFEK